jgi:hypothetical protein
MSPRLALALFIVAACSSEHMTAPPHISYDIITASDAYTPRIGERWTFVNGYGDTTTVTTEAAPDPTACRTGRNVIWHYRKSQARAYWNPGVEDAELLFVLHQEPDSSWRSTASVISFPRSCAYCTGGWTKATWNILDNPAGVPAPYQIIPPTLRRGDHLAFDTHADAMGGTGVFSLGCLVPDGQLVALPGHGEQWRTEYYLEDVETPVYSGTAAVSEQWENCNATHTNPGCGHEKWWFAPGLGLVKVWQINSGSGREGDEDPRITMVRVNRGA